MPFEKFNKTKKETKDDKKNEKTFRRYMEDLDLKPEDFDKKILDIGSGNAEFAKWAKDHDVSSQIYSLDRFLKEFKERDKTVIGSVEKLPFKDNSFDMVISDCAVPNVFISTFDIKNKVNESFSEILRVIKSGGEIRLGNVLMGKSYEKQIELNKFVKSAINKFKKAGIKVELIHDIINDHYEYDKNGNKTDKLLAKAYLIKIHKPK